MASGDAKTLQWLRIPRLSECALSPVPALFWSADGDRLLWSNTAGARLLGHPSTASLVANELRPADPNRRQVMQVARRLTGLNETCLERLRGFGAALGGLATCACTRLPLGGGDTGILLMTSHPMHALSAEQRLHGLIGDLETPAVALTADGAIAGQNAASRDWPFTSGLLADPALQFLTGDALENGHATADLATGTADLFSIGTGSVRLLIASVVPSPACAATPNVATHEVMPIAGESAEPAILIDASRPPETEPPLLRAIEPDSPANESPVTPDERTNSPMDPMAASPSRKLPLRFMWQTDADDRFTLQSSEFTSLIGPRAAAALNGMWGEIASRLGLDPRGHVAHALGTRSTFNGVVLDWPADDTGARLPVELSGVPFYDAAREFAGYRGFGLVRDLAALSQLDAHQRHSGAETPAVGEPEPVGTVENTATAAPDPIAAPEPVADPHANVVPFRAPQQEMRPTLTPVENSAFNEIARQLSARLEDSDTAKTGEPSALVTEQQADPPAAEPAVADNAPAWLAPAQEAPRGHSQNDLALLDRMPAGVLIYRLDRLLYANRALLDQIGYGDLQSLADAGGLDALFVEPGVPSASSTSDTGTPVRISSERSSNQPADAALHTIQWDGDQAMALIFSRTPGGHAASALPGTAAIAAAAAPNHETERLTQILEAVPDALLVLADDGTLAAANRSARDIFGIDASSSPRTFADLFAQESRTAVQDAIEASRHGGTERSRDVLASRPGGSLMPFSLNIGRTSGTEPVTFAVLRDLTMAKKTEAQLLGAQRQADRAAGVKADVLARISHEVRTPLNAIIGFAEVMIGERFGALGNDRYVEYLKDIRASGERVIAIINDMLDLSHIETGKLDLAFVSQNLNDLVEQCVGVMQPQANRERIIIRTSLARSLPWISADARALRQIAMNLIGNSIHLANAGGQVIVSTALTDFGEVVLRVRDTGQGLNDNEMAAALAPFRAPVSPDDVTPGNSGVSLSLTKALVEANRAQFQIKSSPQSGTLIEVRFPATAARASSS